MSGSDSFVVTPALAEAVRQHGNQTQLAALADLHQPALSRHVNGQPFGPIVHEKIAVVAKTLGLTTAEAIVRANEALPTLSTFARLHEIVAAGGDPTGPLNACATTMLETFLAQPSLLARPVVKGTVGTAVDFYDAHLPKKRLADGNDVLVDLESRELRGALFQALHYAACQIDEHTFTQRTSQALAAAARHAAKKAAKDGGAK